MVKLRLVQDFLYENRERKRNESAYFLRSETAIFYQTFLIRANHGIAYSKLNK